MRFRTILWLLFGGIASTFSQGNVGDNATAFSLLDLDSTRNTLDQYKGKVLLLFFMWYD